MVVHQSELEDEEKSELEDEESRKSFIIALFTEGANQEPCTIARISKSEKGWKA